LNHFSRKEEKSNHNFIRGKYEFEVIDFFLPFLDLWSLRRGRKQKFWFGFGFHVRKLRKERF
jgi:hypothetical protein